MKIDTKRSGVTASSSPRPSIIDKDQSGGSNTPNSQTNKVNSGIKKEDIKVGLRIPGKIVEFDVSDIFSSMG